MSESTVTELDLECSEYEIAIIKEELSMGR